LLAHSEKAIALGKIIDADGGTTTIDAGSMAHGRAQSYRDEYPDISIQENLSADIEIDCHPAIGKAIDEVVQNAVSHHPDERTEIRLRLSVHWGDDTGLLVIEDNGAGIDPHEIETLEAKAESALQHGSGVGLWMVSLILRESGGTLTIDRETELGGTRVELALPLAEGAASEPPSDSTTQ
jgi:signal transduction histidine kinase